MSDRIRPRRDVAADWASSNPILALGELGIETDTRRIKVGDGVTAYNSLTAYVEPALTARKTADTIRNNTATLADDPHLTVPVVSGRIYRVEGFLIYDASTTADFKLAWTVPAGSTMWWSAVGPAAAATVFGDTRVDLVVPTGAGTTRVLGGVGVGTKGAAQPAGILIAGADGNLTLQWAQNTAEVSDTTLFAQSFLIATRLA